MEINKNDEIRIYIDGYTSEGAGVGRIGTYPVFIPNTVRGDYILCRIVKPGKTYAWGRCMEILEPSKERIEPLCHHFYECGGCSIMHMSEAERKYFKQDKVKNAFYKIAGIDVNVDETVTDKKTGYRNKNQMPVSKNYVQAMYKTRTNEKVEVPRCIIQDESAKRVTEITLSYLKEKNIPLYEPTEKSGVVRHIYTRVSSLTGEILLIIVATEKIDLKGLVPKLKNEKVAGIVLNINEKHTNTILGEKSITVYGKNYITDRLCGTDFDIYPDSFFQVNKFLTEHLYNKAVKLCNLTGKETVFDLYCGAGTITAALSKGAKKVIGVEIVPSAVKSARQSLERAGIENAEIYEGASEKVAPMLIKGGEKADVVVVDPPRKGCGEELLSAMCEMAPKRIVYVSCDVATCARDVKFLTEHGYKIEKATPFDMFPFTHHVETVALLVRTNL